MIRVSDFDSQNEISILSRFSLNQAASLTSSQTQVDEMISHFAEEASDWRSLVAMASGSLFYRVGKIGTLALPLARPKPLQLLSYGVGLFSEVSAFQSTQRLITTLSGDASNPNLWKWEGHGGLREGFFSSFLAFGMLKGAGYFTQSQSTVLQHLFSDFAMVGGQNASAALGLHPLPEGTLAEQLLHAEAVNLQLGAGFSLMRFGAPAIQALEKGLELSIRSSGGFISGNLGENLTQSQWVGAGAEIISEKPSLLRPIFVMSSFPKDAVSEPLQMRGDPLIAGPRPGFSENVLMDGRREITLTEKNSRFSMEGAENARPASEREALACVSEKLNSGISTLTQTLRELGWGPLWVREGTEGNQFRFTIPNPLLGQSYFFLIDPYGNGPETPLERNLREGFRVALPAMDLAVRELLKDIPWGTALTQVRNPLTGNPTSSFKLLSNRQLRHRRLEALHQLLAEGQGPTRLLTLENGSGPLVDFSASLALRGYPVLIKENDPTMERSHRRWMSHFPAEVSSLVSYHDRNHVDAPTPADRVYWINPSPTSLVKPKGVALEDYLGRDVKPGGYLIIQSDTVVFPIYDYRRLKMDPSRWETLFNGHITGVQDDAEYLLPTSTPDHLYLQIYRLRP